MPASPPAALRVTCWGTRGSVPVPGSDTVRYGGNTPCVEVRRPGGRRYLFDAGTGLRRVENENGPLRAELFITHYHWDHIQGFPFLPAVHAPGSHLRVHGPTLGTVRVEDALARLMSGSHFPVPLEAIAAHLEFVETAGDGWTDGDVRVTSTAVRHPGGAVGYRLDADGASIAYVPDVELGEDSGAGGGLDALAAFVAGADVLILDAMYADAEYPRRRGWGHSTASQAVRLAEAAGVRRLLLFHHDPARTDDQVDAIAREAGRGPRDRGSALEVAAATEGETLEIARR